MRHFGERASHVDRRATVGPPRLRVMRAAYGDPESPRRGASPADGAYLTGVASAPASSSSVPRAAPVDELDGGWNVTKTAMLATHLALSIAHVFAVFASRSEGGAGGGESDAGADAKDPASSSSYEYSPAVVVLLAEMIKWCFSAFMFARECRANAGDFWLTRVKDEVVEATRDYRALRFAVPAAVYLAENHIRFLVLKQLATPITWVVFAHVEIPVVAIMSWWLLRRPISRTQWLAIFFLLDGVMSSEIALCHSKNGGSVEECEGADAYPIGALALVLFCSVLAAFAGIATEHTYKGEYHVSIHLQNAQLYAFGVFGNFLLAMGRDWDRVRGGDALEGFGLGAWAVVITLAAFGLVTSVVVKHLSNIAKVFNSAFGIVVTAALSWMFLGVKLSLPFALSAGVVVGSLYLFYGGEVGTDGRGARGGSVLGPGSGGAGVLQRLRAGVGGGSEGRNKRTNGDEEARHLI